MRLRQSGPLRVRSEAFGGIVASEDPPLLAFVDRTYMREQGWADEEAWQRGIDGRPELLSGPVEVHLESTARCTAACPHCYVMAGPAAAHELDTAGMKQALTALAELGVFHVALGGGEALLREDLVELGEHARALGLVPNLTTSGELLTPALAERLRVFGQINCSLDGIGARARVFRPHADAQVTRRALRILRAAGIATGLNCVVGRDTLAGLDELLAWAVAEDLQEVELLRVKPSGRGRRAWEEQRLTPLQHRDLFPTLLRLREAHPEIALKIDCSFVPMLCHHEPPRAVLEALGICGCEAGNYLLGAAPDGRVSACSFLPVLELQVGDLPDQWQRHPALRRLREWYRAMPEPCASCAYDDLCKGGCRAVAAAEGDIFAPDPECPRVLAWQQR